MATEPRDDCTCSAGGITSSCPYHGHLGGFWAGGDPYAYFPRLWDWLITVHGVHSVIDVGAGEGHAADYFRNRGCAVAAIDGVPGRQIIEHDYTTGPLYLGVEYDLCWSCEFVEHVEERYVSHFLATFRSARLLLMTHAVPGQLGHHHVNCRDSNYWLELLAHEGWRYDPDITRQARELAALDNEQPVNYFTRTGLALWRP